MREKAGETGAIVTLLCDSGDRYLDTYYHPSRVSDHIGDLTRRGQRPSQSYLPATKTKSCD